MGILRVRFRFLVVTHKQLTILLDKHTLVYFLGLTTIFFKLESTVSKH